MYVLWNAKYFSMRVENDYQVQYEYVDFGILVNLSLPTTGIDKCALRTFARSASSPDIDELTKDLMLANMIYFLTHVMILLTLTWILVI